MVTAKIRTRRPVWLKYVCNFKPMDGLVSLFAIIQKNRSLAKKIWIGFVEVFQLVVARIMRSFEINLKTQKYSYDEYVTIL